MAHVTLHGQCISAAQQLSSLRPTLAFCRVMLVHLSYGLLANVLKQSLQIAIDSAIFPEGTTGLQLDVLARKALWSEGLNYLVCLLRSIACIIR
jgi:hypothetical protein